MPQRPRRERTGRATLVAALSVWSEEGFDEEVIVPVSIELVRRNGLRDASWR